MTADDALLAGADWPDLVRRVRSRTPARLLEGRSGAGYRTGTQIDLRGDHAAARDAVRAELDMSRDFGTEFVGKWKLFEVSTQAASKEEYLLRPDLGRRLNETSRAQVLARCASGCDLQIMIGDGLSVTAVAKQVPPLLEALVAGARDRGLKVGQVFVVRHCRVGVLNEIGELLSTMVAVLLIGERPGLATAESLSAYMAYQPCTVHTDANRNLISNIHGRGVSTQEAVRRILNLAGAMMRTGSSGFELREERTSLRD